MDDSSLEDRVSSKCTGLGKALYNLYGAKAAGGKAAGVLSAARLLSAVSDDGISAEALEGALSILYIMGVVWVKGDQVSAVSKDSGFLLGSLGKFLEKSTCAIDDPTDRTGSYKELAKIFESARTSVNIRDKVDQHPLYQRHIVNVLIKSSMVRHWRYQDVYLHVYHREWGEYHLVGRNQHGPSESDEEIAEKAMEEWLKLRTDQYEFDSTLDPKIQPINHISQTHGAVTEYTYRLMVVKDIRVRLNLVDLAKSKNEPDLFRWFTLDEIRNCKGETGDRIMFSTPNIINSVAGISVPLSARHADDARPRVRIREELSDRVAREHLFVVLVVAGAVALLIVTSQILPNLPSLSSVPLVQTIAFYVNLIAGSIVILGVLFGLVNVLIATLRK